MPFISFIPLVIYAQDTTTKKEIRKQQKSYLIPGRPWSIEAPLWIPGFAGSFSYGDLELEGGDGEDPGDPGNPGNPPPGGGIGDIFSRLFSSEFYVRYFYMGRIAFEKKRFISEFDAFGGAVGGSIKFKLNNKDIVQASFRTINTRLIFGYKVLDIKSKNQKFNYGLVVYLGVKANFSSLNSELNNVINKLDINPRLYVPLFGLQNQFTWKRWKIITQGDIGFLLNPDRYSIHISNFFYYRSGRFISLKFGCNHLIIRSRGTILDEEYSIRMTLSGPAAGLVFHF